MKLEVLYNSKNEYRIHYESDTICVAMITQGRTPEFHPMTFRISVYGDSDIIEDRFNNIGIDIFLKSAFNNSIIYSDLDQETIDDLDKYFKLYSVKELSKHSISRIIKIAVQNKLDGLKQDSDESIEVIDVLIK